MEAISATVTAMTGHAVLTCAVGGLVLELVKSQLHLLVRVFSIRSQIIINLISTNQSRISPFKKFFVVLIAEKYYLKNIIRFRFVNLSSVVVMH